MISATTISPLNRRIIDEGGGGIDPSAQAFITAAGITGETQQTALNQLVLDLKGSGSTTNNTDVWSKIYAAYPYCPIDESTATRDAYKWNLKDPRDLDAAFRITWINNPTASVSGITGDGASMYGNTHFNQLTESVDINNFGITVDAATNTGTIANVDMGIYFGTSFFQISIHNVTYTYILGDLPSSVSGTTATVGIRTVSRTASNLLTAYLNGVSDGSETTLGGSILNDNMVVMGRKLVGGSVTQPSARRYRFNAIHQGLSPNESKDLYDAISTYNTALSR